MKRWTNIIVFLLGCLMSFYSVGSVAAQALSKMDEKEIHGAVQSQLDAFSKDDAVRAFALATSSTRTQIGTPDRFLQMVKDQYDVIYRHRVAIFADPEVINGDTIQTVRLTDLDGLVWVALYKMQREADGQWRIEGCHLFGTTSVSV